MTTKSQINLSVFEMKKCQAFDFFFRNYLLKKQNKIFLQNHNQSVNKRIDNKEENGSHFHPVSSFHLSFID